MAKRLSLLSVSAERFRCGPPSWTPRRGKHSHVRPQPSPHFICANRQRWNGNHINHGVYFRLSLSVSAVSGVSATSTLWPSQPNCCSRDSTSTRSSSWTGSVSTAVFFNVSVCFLKGAHRVCNICDRCLTSGRSPRQRHPASVLRRPQRPLPVDPSLRRRQLLPWKRST